MKKKGWMVFILILLVAVQLACSVGAKEEPGSVLVGPTQALLPTAAANLPSQEEPESMEVEDEIKVSQLVDIIDRFVLRPEDLPHDYRIPPGGEQRLSNKGVLQTRGELAGKRYLIETGRLEGWMLKLERRNKEDVAPYVFESQVEVFEDPDGAQTAFSPTWFSAYNDEKYEYKFVPEGCSLGDECIFYYAESLDPATELTTLRYYVAFRYQNALVWVMGRGLDIDIRADYVLDAAEAVFKKLEQTYLASR